MLDVCAVHELMTPDLLVDAFLEDDHAAIDPALPALVRLMAQHRAGRSWHKHGSFKDHLYGTYRVLTLWRQPREICLCGLLHSVYSNEYVDLALFDPKEGRDTLRQELGTDVEAMVHRFCEMPRNDFVTQLAGPGATPKEGMTLSDGRGKSIRLSSAEVAAYLVITVADFVEQWYSWQEGTMSGYPYTADVQTQAGWAATLWPGPFRPGSSGLALVSRLARHLPAFGLPVPTVFDRCTKVIDEQQEAAAAALYWQASELQFSLVSKATVRAFVLEAVHLNPWVAEPRLLAAQLDLIDGQFDSAAEHARRGYELLRTWGVQWDKRVSWQGWVIWARLLMQKARERAWPTTLRLHNNLGLVRP